MPFPIHRNRERCGWVGVCTSHLSFLLLFIVTASCFFLSFAFIFGVSVCTVNIAFQKSIKLHHPESLMPPFFVTSMSSFFDFKRFFFLGGEHAQIKSHYRGHHVAVWLQLIPQLHGRAVSLNATVDNIDPSRLRNNQQQQQGELQYTNTWLIVIEFLAISSLGRLLNFIAGPTTTTPNNNNRNSPRPTTAIITGTGRTLNCTYAIIIN